MNIDYIKRIIDIYKEEPLRVEMDTIVEADEKDLAPCGTVGCISGWAMLLKAKDENPDLEFSQLISRVEKYGLSTDLAYVTRGAAALGLKNWPAYCLFHRDFWPTEYAGRYIGSVEGMDGFCPHDWEHPDTVAKFETTRRKNNAQVMIDLLEEVSKRGDVWWSERMFFQTIRPRPYNEDLLPTVEDF